MMYSLLICEDETLERVTLRKMIEQRYPHIMLLEDARTGKEAVQKAQQFKPDILLMDIKMPEMNGLDAQKQIIAFHPQIKTIIITAHDDFSYAHEAIKYRIFDFLLKPFSSAILYDCIDKILSTPTSRPPVQPAVTEEKTTIQEALDYINSHYLDNLQLTDVASRVHLSEKYFSRYFKEQIGQSFTEYVNQQKVYRAKSLLLHTSVPIYKIAMDLNFSDSAYFTKVFRKYEQLSPLQFRQKHRF
ncbi:response regulator transcription factor [Propionispora vibrioides]|nr:response regulator [Propionispora vibrioides]